MAQQRVLISDEPGVNLLMCPLAFNYVYTTRHNSHSSKARTCRCKATNSNSVLHVPLAFSCAIAATGTHLTGLLLRCLRACCSQHHCQQQHRQPLHVPLCPMQC